MDRNVRGKRANIDSNSSKKLLASFENIFFALHILQAFSEYLPKTIYTINQNSEYFRANEHDKKCLATWIEKTYYDDSESFMTNIVTTNDFSDKKNLFSVTIPLKEREYLVLVGFDIECIHTNSSVSSVFVVCI